jgi:hypothetical protein
MTGHSIDPTDPIDPRDADLHVALRAMPSPRAPHTLAPRVMGLVHLRLAARASATTHTWFEWSVTAQVASVVAFVAMVAGAALLWPSIEAFVDRAASRDAVRLASVFFRSFWQPVMVWVVAGMTVTILFCATVGALLGRLALGGATR